MPISIKKFCKSAKNFIRKLKPKDLRMIYRLILLYFILVIALFFSLESIAQTSPLTTDSRIKTLVYNPNEVYQLKFHYGYQSYIEFSEDEEIEMISIGESFAWRLTPAGKRLFVRPLETAAHTNMTVITNRRNYQFDIKSGEYDGRADDELVYIVRFYYPEVGELLPIPPQLSKPNVPPSLKPKAPVAPRPDAIKPTAPARVDTKLSRDILQGRSESDDAHLNFNYSFAGLSENIAPIKVYDDGKQTFMQFKNDNLVIPSIFAVDVFGNEAAISYVIRDKYVVLPKVELQYTLRLADSLICVFNNKLIGGTPSQATPDQFSLGAK